MGSPGDKHVTSTHYWEVTRYLTGRNLGTPRILCKAPDTSKVMAWLKACPNLHHRDNLSFQDRAELGLSPTYSMEIVIHPLWAWISSFTKRRYNHLESSTWYCYYKEFKDTRPLKGVAGHLINLRGWIGTCSSPEWEVRRRWRMEWGKWGFSNYLSAQRQSSSYWLFWNVKEKCAWKVPRKT